MSEICGNFEVPVRRYLDEAVTNHKSGDDCLTINTSHFHSIMGTDYVIRKVAEVS